MTKMHADELEITDRMVRKLITEQAQHLIDPTCDIQRLYSSGTVHALYLIDNKYVVRLPRIEASSGIEKEWQWLSYLEEHLTVAISTPLFKGEPTDYYPWPWLISHYQQGTNPQYERDNEYKALAAELANFLNELHCIPVNKDMPLSRRGVSLHTMNSQTRLEISKLGDEYNVGQLMQIWDELSQTSEWDKNPVWVHGDLLPGNILTNNNTLTAVIDFSDVGIGDPSCDLIIAWSLLNSSSRSIFRDKLNNIDHNTWQRGKGWALSIAAIMLPYYKTTNPVFARLARRMLDEVIESE